MGIRFSKRITLLPGVRINLSRRGVSATIGPKGLSVNVGEKGTYANVGLPGTGLSSRTKISGEGNPSGAGAVVGFVVGLLVLAGLALLLVRG